MLIVSAVAFILVVTIVLFARVLQRGQEKRVNFTFRYLLTHDDISGQGLVKQFPKLFSKDQAQEILKDLEQEGFLRSRENYKEIGDRVDLPRTYYSLTEKGRSYARDLGRAPFP